MTDRHASLKAADALGSSAKGPIPGEPVARLEVILAESLVPVRAGIAAAVRRWRATTAASPEHGGDERQRVNPK